MIADDQPGSRFPHLPAPHALRRAILSPATWCLLATIDFVLTTNFRVLLNHLGDPDDAVRLVSVREFLHGAPWFDTTLPRIGAPEPLVSHWSRLIDAPVALLIAGLAPAFGPARAELLARIVWPALLLLFLLLVCVRDARRRGGTWAAALALIFAMTSVTAIVQFSPGRIDHHNAMILCTVAGLLFLHRSVTGARAGWIAGALLGLALVIGYEPIALILPALAGVAVLGVWTGDTKPAARATTAAAFTMFAGLVATTRWTQWMPIQCDALAINVPAALACGAAGLWLARGAPQSRIGRVAVAAASASVAVALFAALEPACLRGPFAQVLPEVRGVWLDHVIETKSILAVIATNAPLGWSFIVFVAAGAGAQIVQARRESDPASAPAAAVAVLALILGCWQMKLMPYASWLAAMSLAVFVARLGAFRRFPARGIRGAAAFLLSHATWMLAFMVALGPLRPSPGAPGPDDAAVGGSCLELGSFASLSGLTPGLVAADLELGPYIVATTGHRVVAAPYHRLQAGILANNAILTAPPDESLSEIGRLGVNYIALCQGVAGRRRAVEAAIPQSLEGRLLRNERVEFLTELTPGAVAPIRIWRVQQPPRSP